MLAIVSIMVEYKDRLVEAMTTAGVRTSALAAAIGISYQGVKKVLDGKSAGFGLVNNARAATFLNVTSHWLATGEGSMLAHDSAIGTASDPANAILGGSPTLACTLERLAQALRAMPDSQRDGISRKLAALALAPDSAQLMQSLLASLDNDDLPAPQLTQEELEQGRSLTKAAHKGANFDLTQHGKQSPA